MLETAQAEPRILPRSEHPISRRNISPNAVKVLYRLHNAGYKAYLVGGSVRDLMLGRQPKDFDVGTDARPQEIRRLFRNSRIIGRRFRLAHVYFKKDIIEVSTFRREPDPAAQASGAGELLITSDNTFGTPRDDAFRRDFTVNALFYNIADFTVIDYVGGVEDLHRKLIHCIGDPDIRFQEDPVRMLRACEFAARLGFGIEMGTQEAIRRHARLLDKASPARLTEELLQLLRCGNAGRAFQWMLELGLQEVLLPEAYAMVAAGERGLGEFGRILPVVDEVVGVEERDLSDAVLLAVLLLPQVLLRRYDIEGLDQHPMSRSGLESLIHEIAQPFFDRFTVARQTAHQVTQALMGFQRLCEPNWAPAERARFTRKSYFEDALLLFEVLVRATGEGQEALEEWRRAARRKGGQAGRRRASRRRSGGRRRGRRER